MKFKLRVVAVTFLSLTGAFLLLALDKHNERHDSTAPVEHIALELSPSAESSLLQTPPPDPWILWAEWVKIDSLYSPDAFWSSDMNTLLETLSNAPITAFDVGYKGTQLKATMHLGTQKTVFKPKRYGMWTCGIYSAIYPPPPPPKGTHVKSSLKVTHIRDWICTLQKLLVFIWMGISRDLNAYVVLISHTPPFVA